MGGDVINYSEGYNSGLEKQTSHFLSFMNNSFKSKTNFFSLEYHRRSGNYLRLIEIDLQRMRDRQT